MLLERIVERPVSSLVCLFVLWKLLLFAVAVSSPGVGYDTSTSLLLTPSRAASGDTALIESSIASKAWLPLIEKLTRWDAIYFASIANRGYVFEQEWAFGWGFTRTVSLIARFMKSDDLVEISPAFAASIAVGLANLSHLISVLLLYRLTRSVCPRPSDHSFALVAAGLYIISPAGLFLSAPYAEAPFALLSILGYLLYVFSLQADRGPFKLERDLYVISAGLAFGLATAFRSNGILNGLLFLYDALNCLAELGRGRGVFSQARRLLPLGIGGVLVGLGLVLPQWLAYQEFCSTELDASVLDARPWCLRAIPSIYTWAQDVYWDVGFLRYWTVSNIPLFMLAAPMLAIMTTSAVQAMRGGFISNPLFVQGSQDIASQSTVSTPKMTPNQDLADNFSKGILRRFALPQLVLAVLALTNYHVQIITRISSGYVIWYWWVASALCRASSRRGTSGKRRDISQATVRYMIVYAIVQGGLFASFLPPA